MIRRAIKERLHPRNRFRGGYDFPALVERSPGLAAFVGPNAHGDQSINYADPLAVKALNQALLAYVYGLDAWDVPPGYLCPPIPGRSDYLHHAADLLRGAAAEIPRGPAVSVFDIGMGANAIYPLIGASEYGWRFVGAEIDPAALGWAQAMVAAHPAVSALIECRLQTSPRAYFAGVVKPGEVFDLSICNPPFHASADEAAESTRRKRRHLGAARQTMSIKNFSGTDGELWCDGGELAFVQRMIAESAGMPRLCRWFTTLVSKNAHLPRFQAALRAAGAADVRTIDMTHGQKQSRLLGWSFMWHKSSHMSIKPIIIV